MEGIEFKAGKILLVGDLVFDEYIMGTSSNISYESPIPIVKREFTEYQLGGIGNIANNIISLEGSCDILSIVGKDALEKLIKNKFKEVALPEDLILTLDDYQNSLSTRVFSSGKHVARIDTPTSPIKSRDKIYNFIEDKISNIKEYSAVIIQDSGRMFIDEKILDLVISKALSANVPIILDVPNYHNSNYKLNSLASVNILRTNLNYMKTINRLPLEVDLTKEELEGLCFDFIRKTGIDSLIVTLGSGGLLYVKEDKTKLVEGYKVYVFDASGAGDSLVATLSLCMASKIDIDNTLEISNISGHISCRYMGATPVELGELVEACKMLKYNSDSK